jgi:hypothetical protein
VEARLDIKFDKLDIRICVLARAHKSLPRIGAAGNFLRGGRALRGYAPGYSGEEY